MDIKKIIIILSILSLLAILTYMYARFIGTSGLITKEYVINDNIPSSYDGLKIVHISDIHFGTIITKKKLNGLVNEINLINPDIVVFTGDMIDDRTDPSDKDIDTLIDYLSKIESKYGKYAVLGNHDYDYDDLKIRYILNETNFILLENSYDIIHNENNDKIFIGGVDDMILGKPDINKFIKEANDISYKIILVHEPDYTDKILASDNTVNLILAGHSHNGQVRLPLIGALYTPYGSKKYYDEHYLINNTNLYISSGFGVSTMSIRLFNRPSINFYRLNKN